MSRVEQGSLVIGTVRGARVLVHWSWPVGMLLFTRGFDLTRWAAFAAIVVVHEFGHAFWVWRFNLRVRAIEIHGLGGECRYAGDPTAGEDAVIAWGGVMAQALVVVVAYAVAPLLADDWGRQVRQLFIAYNLVMMGLNLLPFHPLDGATAWKLPRIWFKQRGELRDYLRHREAGKAARSAEADRARRRAADREVQRIEKMENKVNIDGVLPDEINARIDALTKRRQQPK